MRQIAASLSSDWRRIRAGLERNIRNFEFAGKNVQIGRTLLAISAVLTLSLTNWGNLAAPVLGRPAATFCSGIRSFSAFCLGHEEPSPIGVLVSSVILGAVVAGFAPRIVAWFHAWVALSMLVSLSIPDGGESAGAIFAVLLVPICSADTRLWAWSARRARPSRFGPVAYAASIAACVQLAGIYFESGLAKLAVPEWVDGSAMFYIVRDPYFGATGLIGSAARTITNEPLGSAALTWGSCALEVLIGVLVLCAARFKHLALAIVALLHIGIGLVLGLWPFAIVMIGAATLCAYRLDRGLPVESCTQPIERKRVVY